MSGGAAGVPAAGAARDAGGAGEAAPHGRTTAAAGAADAGGRDAAASDGAGPGVVGRDAGEAGGAIPGGVSPGDTRPGDAASGDAVPGDGDAAPDGGADEEEPERGPLRRCLVTRERGDRERMLRFVVGPEGAVVPDLAARLPGRGMWLSARGDVLEIARARGAFPRAARRPVTVPAELSAMVRDGLSGRVADLLGFARRAGEAVAGFTKAREWVQSGRAALVLQACDGSAEERARLLSGADGLPALLPLEAERLGAVFGRERAVHVAVARGRLAERIALECGRLAGVMAVPEGAPARGRRAAAPGGRAGTQAGPGQAGASQAGATGAGAAQAGRADGTSVRPHAADARGTGAPAGRAGARGTGAAGVPAAPRIGRTV